MEENMKKTSRLLALLLAVLMMAGGCGGKTGGESRGEIRRATRCERGRRGVGETDLRAAQGAGEAAPQTASGGRDGRSGAGRNREADRGVRCEIRRRDRIQRSRLQGLQRPESPLRPPDARVGEGVVRT